MTSFGASSWVQRVLPMLLDECIPRDRVLCRSDSSPEGAGGMLEVVDKNVWLAVVQRCTGLSRQQVLLVDDSRRNTKAARSAGFLALQVGRGLGFGHFRWVFCV